MCVCRCIFAFFLNINCFVRCRCRSTRNESPEKPGEGVARIHTTSHPERLVTFHQKHSKTPTWRVFPTNTVNYLYCTASHYSDLWTCHVVSSLYINLFPTWQPLRAYLRLYTRVVYDPRRETGTFALQFEISCLINRFTKGIQVWDWRSLGTAPMWCRSQQTFAMRAHGPSDMWLHRQACRCNMNYKWAKWSADPQSSIVWLPTIV